MQEPSRETIPTSNYFPQMTPKMVHSYIYIYIKP
jgi:hypothetical protein